MNKHGALLISPKLLGDVAWYYLGVLHMCAGIVLNHSGFVYACVRVVTSCGTRVKSVMQVSVQVVHVK